MIWLSYPIGEQANTVLGCLVIINRSHHDVINGIDVMTHTR